MRLGFMIIIIALVCTRPVFSQESSDPKAIEIAEKVFEASGGASWKDVKNIKWNFFGSRQLAWNVKSGDFHVQFLKKPIRIEMNLHQGNGKIYLNEALETHPDTVSKYLEKGKQIFYNDSYWLLMPLKLIDPGVTLKYKGEETDSNGVINDIIKLTFTNVGATPENKYHVYIDRNTSLVTRWDYFDHYDDIEPALSNPWTDYKNYGGLILSSGRGNKKISEIEVD